MTESGYQSKIIKSIIADGGTAITGMLKAGEADIQAGYPMHTIYGSILLKLAIEVKTPDNYDRVMRAVKEVDGLYVIVNPKPLKGHETLQIHKLNDMRRRGGCSLFAHSYQQVKEYMSEQIKRVPIRGRG